MGLPFWKNAIFWDFVQFCFYSQKKVFFLSRTLLNLVSSLILSENKYMNGLTPLAKSDFWDHQKFFVFIIKKGFFFVSKSYWTFFLVLLWLNLRTEKCGIFWPKAWVNSFGKMRFLGLWRILFFYSNEVFFFLEHY